MPLKTTKTKTPKVKSTKIEPTRIYVTYNQETSGGEICAGQENDSWPNHEDEHIEVTFEALYRNPPEHKFFYDSIEVDPELLTESALYLAVIRYFDGGTFGTTYGHFYLVGLYTSHRQAQSAIEEAKTGEGYKPWIGYFSGYESDKIYLLRLED